MQNQPQQPTPQDELSVLEGEISDAMNAFESDFALAVAQKVNESPELESLFFDDREEFFKQILTFQNEFLEGIKSKMSKASELRGSIEENGKQADFDSKMQEFAKAHPEVDIRELMAFADTLPQEIKDQLNELPPRFFFDALLEIFNRKDELGGEQPQVKSGAGGAGLPEQLNGVASNQELSADENLPMTRQ